MAKLIYAINQSLDGYVDHTKIGPPSPKVFRHFIDYVRNLTGFLYGRTTYDIMSYWDGDQPEWNADEQEFAAAWRSKPKWVVSRSLNPVGPNATLIPADIETAIRKLKTDLPGEIGIGGPNLAQTLTAASLIDEYRIYLRPVVIGTGTPYFAGTTPPLRLAASDPLGEDIIRLTYIPA